MVTERLRVAKYVYVVVRGIMVTERLRVAKHVYVVV